MIGELVLIIECVVGIYRPGASWTTRVIIALLYSICTARVTQARPEATRKS